MRTETATTMGQMEYENFVNMVNAFTEEQKWIALRLMPANLLFGELNCRFEEMETTLNSIKSIAKA